MTLLFKIMMTTLILCPMATTLCLTKAAVSWQQSKVEDKYMAYAGLFFIVLVVDMVLLSVILIWHVNWLLIE